MQIPLVLLSLLKVLQPLLKVLQCASLQSYCMLVNRCINRCAKAGLPRGSGHSRRVPRKVLQPLWNVCTHGDMLCRWPSRQSPRLTRRPRSSRALPRASRRMLNPQPRYACLCCLPVACCLGCLSVPAVHGLLQPALASVPFLCTVCKPSSRITRVCLL